MQPQFLQSTPAQRWAMRACVGANIFVALFCVAYVALTLSSSGTTWLYFVAAVIAGYFLADFASGLIHWSLDTWFDAGTMGRAVAIAREHHTHPQNILYYGFLEHATLGSAPSAATIGPLALATAVLPPSVLAHSMMTAWGVVATCLLFGTAFHNLGHKASRSRPARLAQRLRLVISPDHHWVHHREDQLVRYCVINGWANYACDTFHVWRGLERLVRAATGAEPRRDDLAWQRTYAATGKLQAPRISDPNCEEGHGCPPTP